MKKIILQRDKEFFPGFHGQTTVLSIVSLLSGLKHFPMHLKTKLHQFNDASEIQTSINC
jgi:hypothetical protein